MKDSQYNYWIEKYGCPALVREYYKAHMMVYKRKVFVHKPKYHKFYVMELDLHDTGYTPMEYAYVVCVALKGWVNKKGLLTCPMNLFLSDYALQVFLRVASSDYVRLKTPTENDNNEVMASELLVARLYVHYNITNQGYMTLADTVKSIRPLLSPTWFKHQGEYKSEVLDILTHEYPSTIGAKSYKQIWKRLTENSG